MAFLKILDRYIIKKYLFTLAFVVLIFTLIACVIDLSEKIEDFRTQPMTHKQILIGYYLNFCVHINAMLLPLYVLISVIFFTSRMAEDSEIISILNAGVRFRRIARPFLIAAGFVVTLHLLFNHLLVPLGNKTRLALERKYIYKSNDKGKTDNVHLFLGKRDKIFVAYYRKGDSTGRDVRFEQFDSLGNVKSILKVETMIWKGYPNHWKLQQCQKRTFNGLTETLESMPEIDTTLALAPEDFTSYRDRTDELTTPELFVEKAKIQMRGTDNAKNFDIAIHRRTSEPFSIFILTLIGMALAARKVRGGIGFHLATGIALGAIDVFLTKFAVTFANLPDVPALLGVWIPNIIFGGIAAFLVSKAQK